MRTERISLPLRLVIEKCIIVFKLNNKKFAESKLVMLYISKIESYGFDI